MHCTAQLTAQEGRWGTGLCDNCYSECVRECEVCAKPLALRELHFMSGMCNRRAAPRDVSMAAADEALAKATPAAAPPGAELDVAERFAA